MHLIGRNSVKMSVDPKEQNAELVKLIGATGPVLYVESDRLDRADDVIRFIDQLGYDIYWHCPAMFNRENFFNNQQNVFGNTISRNLLCMARGSKVENLARVPVP